MTASDILIDGFTRVHDVVHRHVEGLDLDTLTFRADPEANTIAWLVWHLSRGQDAQVTDALGGDEVWPAFAGRFALPFPLGANGYGHTSADVAAVRVEAPLLLEYLDAVHARTVALLASVSDGDLERIVDERWDPPVTLAVRLVSVLSDDLQHAGQVGYVKGLAERA